VEELRRLRVDAPPILSEVGYYKLDLIRAEYRERSSRDQVEDDVVLLAPSWGEANLLEANGVDLVRSLRKSGFRVIVRPHPQFFHSLYPQGTAVIVSLQGEFGDDDGVEFELNINSQDSFYRSALMISDWSGAAYEYALGTFRPVLFVDTPQKIFNPAWQDVGLPPFEKTMRTEVGVLVGGSDVARAGTVAEKLIGGGLIDEDDLRSLAKSIVFNLDASAEAGAAAVVGSLAT
jgi:YidC/Oxa1 family membrane protein insertase